MSHAYPQTHPSIVSTSTSSTKSSSFANSCSRYPSGMTNLTALSADFSEDQLDILNSLDYDDTDDAIIDNELVHRNREALIQQLYASERAYIETLSLGKNLFLDPLQKNVKQSSFHFLGMKKMICTEREIRWLFGNFEEILKLQCELFECLERRLRIWGPTQIISDVFENWFPRLREYHVYLDNYDIAVTTYERLIRYHPFRKFLETVNKNPALKGATLLSLLQIPVGCLNRYAQLISKLSEVTTPMHPDHIGLQRCKRHIMELCDEIKSKVEDADNVDQVLMIHQALTGAPFGVKAQRRLLLQGQLKHIVMSVCSVEERTYFLFSDMLVFVRPKQDGRRTVLQYKGHINLERAQGVDTLNTTFVGASGVHILQTRSKEEQQEWIRHIETVIHQMDSAAKRKGNATSRKLAQSFSS